MFAYTLLRSIQATWAARNAPPLRNTQLIEPASPAKIRILRKGLRCGLWVLSRTIGMGNSGLWSWEEGEKNVYGAFPLHLDRSDAKLRAATSLSYRGSLAVALACKLLIFSEGKATSAAISLLLLRSRSLSLSLCS